MKITADVEVSTRVAASLNMNRRRSVRSNLCIGYLPGNRKKVFILHQTMKNTSGTKYLVNDNILKVHVKFISQGKASISFKNPEVDLVIKGEAVEMKYFVQTLQHFIEKAVPLNTIRLSNLAAAPTKVAAKPKIDLTVVKHKDLQKIDSLPRSLEILRINLVKLQKLDARVFRLQHLRILDLSENNLEDLPEQISLLPALQEFLLRNNRFGSRSKFKWLEGETLKQNLVHLDLSFNEITFFPRQICRLQKLRTLNFDNNELRRLPNCIYRLEKLQILTLSNNRLEWLPPTFQFLGLSSLDLSHNAWKRDFLFNTELRQKVCSLIDSAAQVVLRCRIKYSFPEVPQNLVEHLDNAAYCWCGVPIYPSTPNTCSRFQPARSIFATTFEFGKEPVIGPTTVSPRFPVPRESPGLMDFDSI